MNNFPTEPKMYVEEDSNTNSNKSYLMMGIVGVVLAAALTFVAIAVS